MSKIKHLESLIENCKNEIQEIEKESFGRKKKQSNNFVARVTQ